MAGGSERFVPNDLYLNSTTHTVLVLTGPNMGGKSTYLRQAALVVIWRKWDRSFRRHRRDSAW